MPTRSSRPPARQSVDQQMQRGKPFSDPSIAGKFFRDKLAGLEREVFAAAFLNTRHRLIDYTELLFGIVDGAECIRGRLVESDDGTYNLIWSRSCDD